VTFFFPRCLEKNLQLNFSISPDFPKAVRVDPLRFRQIILNLLSNAVKFTERGSVKLDAKVFARSALDVILQITVADTGIGIATSDISRLFSRFQQLDAKVTGGSGLGLFISARLVELMKGTIAVDSQLGIGSEFRLTVPFPIVEQHLPEKPLVDVLRVRSEFCDRPILVVDDVDFNRRVLCRFLKDLGFTTVLEAPGGLEAIQLAQMKDFAAIFMDIYMPDVDGLTATARIRTLQNHQNTPIFGLSASITDESNMRKCKDTFDSFISKPFQFEQIQFELEAHCGFKFDSVQLATGGMSVLIVDDQAMIRRLVAIELNKDAIDVDQCASGREAIERLRSQKFDVVLLDRIMPDMNGIETIAHIRERVPNPPAIIMMSSDLQPVDAANCKKAGADEVMEKPIKVLTFKLLWDKIKADRARKATLLSTVAK